MKTAWDYLADAVCGIIVIAVAAAAFIWLDRRRK
jgi:hypothetical protein